MDRSLFSKCVVLAFFTMTANTITAQKNNTDQYLTRQQQSIVSISALTAVGDTGRLKIRLNAGLDSGLTINEIKEVLVQLYAYCGFPRSLNGINTFMSVLKDRKAKGIQDTGGKDATPINDNDKYITGKKTLQALTGREETSPAGANAFAPAIDTFLKEHLFADIFSRDILTHQQRELVTVSALSAMSGVTPQLQSHIRIAKNTGLTQSQLHEAFNIVHNILDYTAAPQQQDLRKFRIAKIEIYPDHLGQYKKALAEHARSAMRAEPGVLALQAVYDKAHPTMVTVFEIYANEDAYQAHLKTPHFLKYKNGTLKMVKSLELVEVAPIAIEIKPQLSLPQNPILP